MSSKERKDCDDCYNLTAGMASISQGAGVTIAVKLSIWLNKIAIQRLTSETPLDVAKITRGAQMKTKKRFEGERDFLQAERKRR